MESRQEIIRKKSAQLYARQNIQKLKGVSDLQLLSGDEIEQYLPNNQQIQQILWDKIYKIHRMECPLDTELPYQDFDGIVEYLSKIIDKNQTYYVNFDYYGNIIAVKIDNIAEFLASLRQVQTTLDFSFYNQFQIIDGHVDEMTIQLTHYLI